MKVAKISDTAMEFVLSSEELIDKSIDIAKLSANDLYTQEVVFELIEEAQTIHNITIKNNNKYKIYINSDKLNNEITITVSSFDSANEFYSLYSKIAEQIKALSDKDENLGSYDASVLEKKIKEKSSVKLPNLPMIPSPKVSKFSIYEFNSINDIKAVFDEIDIHFYDETVFKYKNKYYLILKFMKNNNDKKKAEIILSEHSLAIIHVSFQLILCEYGECLIKSNAREIINFYY